MQFIRGLKRKFGFLKTDTNTGYDSNKKPNTQFAPSFTNPFERELWQDFTNIAEEVLGTANLPNVDARKQEQEKNQRLLFGKCLKNTFIFNPLSDNADLRFMRQTDIWNVEDEVYTYMSNAANAPSCQLYLLRAISGAGKTGTILNAVARKAYLIYMQCDTNKGGVARDYTDENAKTLADELHKALLNSPGLSNEDKKKIAECHCAIFWLASILILAALREKHSYTPEQWIFWSNNGGKATIQELQLKLISKLNESEKNLETMSSTLKAILREAIKKVQSRFAKLWLAIDEAQILQNTVIGDRQLLHILAFDAVPASVIGLHMIVAGTRMSSFENLVHSGVAKKLSVFDLAKTTIGYPYVTSEQALTLLGHYFDMSKVIANAELLSKIQYCLQGRLRNVVRFLQLLQEKRTEDKRLSFVDLVSVALNALIAEIKEYIDERLNFFLEKPEIKEKFLLHLTTLVHASVNNPTQLWNVDNFKQQFGCEPEDSGFLFFTKTVSVADSGVYQYSIKEKYVTDILLSHPKIRQFKLMHALNLIKSDINLGEKTAQELGLEFERLLSHIMLSSVDNVVQAKCVPRPIWLTSIVCQWKAVAKHTSVELRAAFEVLKDTLPSMTEKENRKELWQQLASKNSLWRFFFQLDNQSLYKTMSEDKLFNYLQQVLDFDKRGSDKCGELLFFLIRPRDMLLNPSPLLGPDIVGFLECGSNREVCLFTVSASLYKEENTQKYEKNQRKINPRNFYYCEGKRAYYNFNKTLKLLPSLPRLSFNITVPYSNSKPKSGPKFVEIDILTPEDLKHIDPSFADAIQLMDKQIKANSKFWEELQISVLSQDVDFESETNVDKDDLEQGTASMEAIQIDFESETNVDKDDLEQGIVSMEAIQKHLAK